MGRRKQRTVFRKKGKEIFTASEINRLNSKAKKKKYPQSNLGNKASRKSEGWAREKGMSSEEWERPGRVLGRAGGLGAERGPATNPGFNGGHSGG